MSRRKSPSAADQVIALQAASLLLGYPDAALYAQLPLLREAADALPQEAASSLRRMVDHLEGLEQHQAEQAYVDLFDLRRRCCLYLTYFAFGDTRKRGMALLKFTHAYKGAGRELIGDELPDHLSVVCEFAAAGDLAAGLTLLAENRAGIELIRLALADAGSAYVHALCLIRAVLPDPAPQDLERAMDLARTGPPEEEVGLEPFAPPEYMGATRR
ncbi:MAG: nitrate reductase molybdenum cofactor assembly chaperone [Mycobacteriales bacterium]|nr:nitrate reductase molybdenum cofactor assembly chaperone [Mycobacteriales bacterium]